MKKTCKLDIQIAESALSEGDHEKAWIHFKKAAHGLMNIANDKECNAWFISTVQKLSHLSFILGKELTSLPEYLHKAHGVAANIGDKRSHALINMHLGRLYYFSDRRSDALIALSVGLNEIEELGDEDILDQSAGFLGLYYYMQGLFREALVQLERAEGFRITGKRSAGQSPGTGSHGLLFCISRRIPQGHRKSGQQLAHRKRAVQCHHGHVASRYSGNRFNPDQQGKRSGRSY